MLQEQHIDKNKKILEKYKDELKCELYYTSDERNNLSIIKMVKKEIGIAKIESEIIIKGRALNISIVIGRTRYNIVNIYAPAAQKDRLNFFA